MAYDSQQCDPNVDVWGEYERNNCASVMTPDQYVAAISNPPYPPFDFARWENSGDLAGFMAAWDEYNKQIWPIEQAAEKNIINNTDYVHITQTVEPFKLDQYPSWRAMKYIQGYNGVNREIFERVFMKLSEATNVNPYEPYDEKYAQWEASHGVSNPAPYQTTAYATPKAAPANVSTAPVLPAQGSSVLDAMAAKAGISIPSEVSVAGYSMSPWLLVGAAAAAYFLFFRGGGGGNR